MWDKMARELAQDEWDMRHYQSKYDLKTFEKKIIESAKKGMILPPIVIAGLCEVGNSTISRWTDPDDKYYKPEFDRLCENARTISASVVAKYHAEALTGVSLTQKR